MTQALTKKEKVMSLVALLQSKKSAIDDVATRAITGEVLIKTLQVACSRNPQLADCTPLSLLNALICAGEFGLRLGPAGHFYILPFKNKQVDPPVMEATPVVGYKGLIELVTRDDDVAGVEARLVRMNDVFELQYGTTAGIKHVPARGERGNIVGAYCVVTMPNAHKQFDFMSRDELEAIKARSPLGRWNKGPWKLNKDASKEKGNDNDFGEMCKKSITRRTLKYVPIGLDAQDLLARADELESDTQSITLNVEGAADGLAERLTAALEAPKDIDADFVEAPEFNQDDAADALQGESVNADEGESNEAPDEKSKAAPGLLDRLDAR